MLLKIDIWEANYDGQSVIEHDVATIDKSGRWYVDPLEPEIKEKLWNSYQSVKPQFEESIREIIPKLIELGKHYNADEIMVVIDENPSIRLMIKVE